MLADSIKKCKILAVTSKCTIVGKESRLTVNNFNQIKTKFNKYIYRFC